MKPEWLQELLKLGALSKDSPQSLEVDFALPSESKFRPGSGTKVYRLKDEKLWQPNEERSGMFRGMSFIFIGERGREVSEGYKEVVERGQGTYELFTVDGGTPKWTKLLERARERAARVRRRWWRWRTKGRWKLLSVSPNGMT